MNTGGNAQNNNRSKMILLYWELYWDVFNNLCEYTSTTRTRRGSTFQASLFQDVQATISIFIFASTFFLFLSANLLHSWKIEMNIFIFNAVLIRSETSTKPQFNNIMYYRAAYQKSLLLRRWSWRNKCRCWTNYTAFQWKQDADLFKHILDTARLALFLY